MGLLLTSEDRDIIRKYPKSLTAQRFSLHLKTIRFQKEFVKALGIVAVVERLNKILSK